MPSNNTALRRDLRKVLRFIESKKVGVVKDPELVFEVDSKDRICRACLIGMARIVLGGPDAGAMPDTPFFALSNALRMVYPEHTFTTISRLGRRAFIKIVRHAIEQVK